MSESELALFRAEQRAVDHAMSLLTARIRALPTYDHDFVVKADVLALVTTAREASEIGASSITGAHSGVSPTAVAASNGRQFPPEQSGNGSA